MQMAFVTSMLLFLQAGLTCEELDEVEDSRKVQYSENGRWDQTKIRPRPPGLHAKQPFCQENFSSRSLQFTLYTLEPDWLVRLLLSCGLL